MKPKQILAVFVYGILAAFLFVSFSLPAAVKPGEIRAHFKKLRSRDRAEQEEAIQWLSAYCPMNHRSMIQAARNRKTAGLVMDILDRKEIGSLPVLEAVLKSGNLGAQQRAIATLKAHGAKGASICLKYIENKDLRRYAVRSILENKATTMEQIRELFSLLTKHSRLDLETIQICTKIAQIAGKKKDAFFFDAFHELMDKAKEDESRAGFQWMQQYLSSASSSSVESPELLQRLRMFRSSLENTLEAFGKQRVKETLTPPLEPALNNFQFEKLSPASDEAKTWSMYFLIINVDKEAPYMGFMTDYISNGTFNTRSRMQALKFLLNRAGRRTKLAILHKIMMKGDSKARRYALNEIQKTVTRREFIPLYIHYAIALDDLSPEMRWEVIYRISSYVDELANVYEFPIDPKSQKVDFQTLAKIDPTEVQQKIMAYWKRKGDSYEDTVGKLAPEMKKLLRQAESEIQERTPEDSSGIKVGDDLNDL